MSANIPKPNKRPPMPMIVPSRSFGKRYCQLCVILNDYKTEILTIGEAADAIFRLLRGDE